MKYTLLQLVQRIMESLTSDEVNSYNDTEESLAVANIIKECYFDIVGMNDLPNRQDVFQLQASGDSTKPTLMYVPEFAMTLERVKYNNDTSSNPSWYDVQYIDFDEFLAITGSLDVDENTVDSMAIKNSQGQTFTFKFRNDRLPTYYTSFDDDTLLFDSYDSAVNSTLAGSKTTCWGMITPTFTMSDSFTPDLDARQFQLLLQSAKAQAFLEIKQIENPKAEKKERKNQIMVSRTKHKVDRQANGRYKGYGRK